MDANDGESWPVKNEKVLGGGVNTASHQNDMFTKDEVLVSGIDVLHYDLQFITYTMGWRSRSLSAKISQPYSAQCRMRSNIYNLLNE